MNGLDKYLYKMLLVSVVLLVLCSCSKKTDEDLDRSKVLRQEIASCRAEVVSSSDRISYDDARKKNAQAIKAAAELKKLAGRSDGKMLEETLKGIDEDLLAIGSVEELALCRKKLADKIVGLTLSSYRSSRSMMLSSVLKALKVAVVASDEMPAAENRTETDNVTGAVNRVAESARTIAEFLTKNRYSNDKGGREKLAADLDAIAANPPPELSLFLSLAYLVSGQHDLALFEIENCNTSSFSETNYLSVADKKMFYHIIRGWVLHSFGWKPLSDQEFSALEKMMSGENEMMPTENIEARNQTLSFWHLFLAYHYGYEEYDIVRMDQHIAWLIRLNPDSELVVYLTGQRKGADGSLAHSGRSLEMDFAGTEDEAIVKILAERVRAVRDSGKSEPPPRLATSPRFLLNLSMTLAVKYAKKTAESEPFQKMLVTIRDFWKLKRPDVSQSPKEDDSIERPTSSGEATGAK